MNEDTAFAIVWTACVANMAIDAAKLAKKIYVKKTTK